jgi:hypothetical protein
MKKQKIKNKKLTKKLFNLLFVVEIFCVVTQYRLVLTAFRKMILVSSWGSRWVGWEVAKLYGRMTWITEEVPDTILVNIKSVHFNITSLYPKQYISTAIRNRTNVLLFCPSTVCVLPRAFDLFTLTEPVGRQDLLQFRLYSTGIS